jgi:hypothetical protein
VSDTAGYRPSGPATEPARTDEPGGKPRGGRNWLFPAVPTGRLAAFRTLAYLFIPFDLLVFTPWTLWHKDVPGELYRPLLVGRVLPLPVPTEALVIGVFAALLVTCVFAAGGKAPRALGWVVFGLYFEWMLIAMSYGKVDHDRFGYLVALAALPTAGAARWGDRTPSERAGWALRVTQLAVIATYFFAAFAKLRFGGLAWLNSATLTWAIMRRGTAFGDWLMELPGAMVAMQWFIVAFEVASPIVLFVSERARRRIVGILYAFHAGVYATVSIAFWPHLVALAAFLPLERVRPVEAVRARVRPRADRR